MEATEKRGILDDDYLEPTCAPLNHPLRVRILEVANTQGISPVQFATERMEPQGVTFKNPQHALSHISYHFRELEKAGCIKIVATHQRRGATEHVYRGTATVYFTDAEFEKLPLEQRRTLSRTTFQGLIARVDGAMRAETFDGRTDRWLTWVPMELDDRGWAEFTAAMAGAFGEVEQIRHDARNRLAESGDKAIPATFGMVGFESSPTNPPPLADDGKCG
jgi:hypothetical protein